MLDLLVVGGGINGAAIAREAALNGLSVLLVERDDLASHTSSASSGLIHGGLRYLEQMEFGLVRESLAERERLLHVAPHLVRPMAFAMPHVGGVRPWWIVRAGLLLYDLLGWDSSLPRSRGWRRGDARFREPLADLGRGFVYSDARVDDGRLTVLNAVDAASAGAEIATRTALVGAIRDAGAWQAELSDGRTVHVRAIVNAAGPWVAELLPLLGVRSSARVRLVKGSHIVVPCLYEGDHAYTLEQPDRRIVFAIPWASATIVGTTDVAVERPEDVGIAADETAYLCAAANRFFRRQTAPDAVIASWSGVRPLHDDGSGNPSSITRDYVLELDREGAPLLSVFGGKITTARALAEEALGKIGDALNLPVQPRTRTRPLPGGDIDDLAGFEAEVAQRWPFLAPETAARLVQGQGTRLREMLAEVRSAEDLGESFGHGLTALEVQWMVEREWARTAEDVLFRRSKLGLLGDVSLIERVRAYLADRLP